MLFGCSGLQLCCTVRLVDLGAQPAVSSAFYCTCWAAQLPTLRYARVWEVIHFANRNRVWAVICCFG